MSGRSVERVDESAVKAFSPLFGGDRDEPLPLAKERDDDPVTCTDQSKKLVL